MQPQSPVMALLNMLTNLLQTLNTVNAAMDQYYQEGLHCINVGKHSMHFRV